jgi:hypothetical protein
MSGRIRTIKPEILEDDKTAALTDAEWRLFVSAFLLADDHGNFRASPALVDGQVFWASRIIRESVASLLESLASRGLISLYAVRGQPYAKINGWPKHQKVDKPGAPRMPSIQDGEIINDLSVFESHSRTPRESVANDSRLTPIPIPIPIPTSISDPDREGISRTRESERLPPPPPVKTMAEARALIAPLDAKVRLFEHWQQEHARVHGSSPVLVAPSAGLESAARVYVHANGDEAAAMAVITRFIESRHEYWSERKWALWLLENSKNYEQARLEIPRKETTADECAF